MMGPFFISFFCALGFSISPPCLPNSTQACYPVSIFRTGGYADVGCSSAQCDFELVDYILSPNSPPVPVIWPDNATGLGDLYASVEAQAIDVYGRLVFSGNARTHPTNVATQVVVPAYMVTGEPFANIDIWCSNPITNKTNLRIFNPSNPPQPSQVAYPVAVYRTGGLALPNNIEARCARPCDGWWLIDYLLDANSSLQVTWPPNFLASGPANPASTQNLSYALVEVQAIDALGRLVYRNAARNCTIDVGGNCDSATLATRQASVTVRSSDFMLDIQYQPQFPYCNFTIETSFPENLVTVPLCVGGEAYVHHSECNSTFSNASLPSKLQGSDYGTCSQFLSGQYCETRLVGWTDNLIMNGKAQYPNTMFWYVVKGTYVNQGPGSGFLPKNAAIKTNPTLRTQIVDLLASGADVRLLDSFPMIQVVVQVSPAAGIDNYRFRVELRATASGPAVGNAIFNDGSTSKINGNTTFSLRVRPSTIAPFRFLYFEDSGWDDTSESIDGPYIREVSVQLNLNECLDNNGGCHPRRQCIDQLAPPARCGDCAQGYQVEGQYNCTQINLCLLSTLCPAFSFCATDDSPQGYSCICNLGYVLNNSMCLDVDECITGISNDTNGGCGSDARCLNVQGATSPLPVCLPIIENCSLAVNNITTTCAVTLPNNSGGQNISVRTRSLAAFNAVYFGPAYDPQRFRCDADSFQAGLVSCTLPSGAVGKDLAFTFLWCGTTGCYSVDARIAGTFSFPVPLISGGSLRLYPSGPIGSPLNAASNFGEVISFVGSYFIGFSQLLNVPDYVVALTNGTVSIPCRLLSYTEVSTVVCETPSASGIGYRFRISLNAEILATGNDVYNYPPGPVIISVSGCAPLGSGTAECPTIGQKMINVSGTGFTGIPAVLVGGKVCNRLTKVFDDTISQILQCQLPSFTGKFVDVVVMIDSDTLSLPAPLISYASPNISSMTGCPGLLSTSFQATECDRSGLSVITFTGDNFGSARPTILIGNLPCMNVTTIVPHRKVECSVPPNLGTNLGVQFVVAGGAVGFPPLKLSYAQCAPGSVSLNTLSCTPCVAGTYADGFGLVVCLKCPDGSSSLNSSISCSQCAPGTFALAGMPCMACGPGTFSVERGASVCEDCAAGSFNPAQNSTYCQNCERGKYQGSPGSTSCTNCSTGQYAEFEQTKSCLACDKGTFAPSQGLSICIECIPGSYVNDVGAVSCLLCRPGSEAPSPGTSECSPCRFGYSASSNGTVACLPCDAGRAQAVIGQASCALCGVGTAQPTTGRDVCDLCLPGTYNDGSSPSICLNCNAGKHAEYKSASTCDLCEVGTFSEVGSKSCAKCIFGYYTSDNSSDSCLACPIGAAATESRETCECPVGYFGARSISLANRTVLSCIKCKKGSRCDTTGVTVQTLEVLPGFWRPSTLSESYYPCRNRQLCLGGINSECLENREGILCGVCKRGYTASSSEKACTPCPSKSVSWGYTVLILLALFLVLLLCYFVTLKIYNLQQKLLIELSKEQDVKEVAKMQELINEYNVGDEYFDHFRKQAQAAEEEATEEEQPVEETPAEATDRAAPVSTLSSVTVQAQHLLNAYLLRKSRNIRKAPNFIYKVKILLGFFQVASLMPLNSGIEWPRQWQSFIVAFSVFNFDFVPWSNLGCATPLNYLDKAMIVGFVPIVVILFLALVTYLYFRVDGRLLIDTQLQVQQRKENSWRQFVKLVLFTVFLLYPFASKITLAVYNCVSVEGHSYLVTDLAISCEDSKYVTIACINILFLVMYPLGVPLAYFFLLNRVKLAFREPRTLLQYGFLYDAYANDRWYWEILDMLHKLALTSLVTFLPTNAVLIASMCVTIGYMILLLLGHPYIRKGDDRFHLWVQCNLFLLALMGQILGTLEDPYGSTFATPGLMEILLSTLLILINIGLLLAFLVIAGRNVRKLYFTVQKAKPGHQEGPVYMSEPEPIDLPQQIFAKP